MRMPLKFRAILAFDFVLIALSVVSLFHISDKVTLPASFTERSGEIVVDSSSGALAIGDMLLSVSGDKPKSELHLEYLLDEHRGGDKIEIEVMRDAQVQRVSLQLVPYYGFDYLLSISISGALYLFFGLFLLLKRPDDKSARLAHWMAVTIAATILFTWGSDDTTGIGVLLKMIFVMSYAMTPAVFMHFSITFPAALHGWRSWLHRIFYTSGGIIGLTGATIVWLLSKDAIAFSAYEFLSVTSNINFGIGTLLAVGNFVYSYRHAAEEADRRKIRWISLGNAFSVFSYIVLWLVPKLILGFDPIVSEGVVMLLTSVAPAAFTVAILRYQLFDIDRIINRTTVYVIVIACVLAIYGGVVAIIAALIQREITGLTSVPSIIASIIVAICFDPLRKIVQRVVDKKFFRVQYDYRLVISRINTELEGVYDRSSLKGLLERTFTELYHAADIKIALDDTADAGTPIKVVATTGHRAMVEEGSALQIIDGGPHEITHPLHLEDGRLAGSIVLGPKLSGLRYSTEDIEVLIAIASAASLALQRIVVTQELLQKSEEAKRLKELNELKSLFVSSVSHDLKTPLTSIKMFAEMLETAYGPDEATAREYLGIIGGETDRLKSLIDNILDFAKIERGVMRYNFASHDLNEVINTVLVKLRYLLEMQRFEVDVDLCVDDLPVYIDRAGIESVLMNLISNAIKYSGERKYLGITTSISENRASIIVRDHGIGISRADLEHIFDAFYRCEDRGGSQASGAGLGLANVKHILSAHQASINVESVVGEGTSFTLSFELETIHA